MGMVDAFSDSKANFAGMDGRPDWLYISAVIHKAFVDVNEEGTEAAAATAVIMKARGMPAPPPVFRADHPFVFLIQENRTGSILFMGRVKDPTMTGE
jgi:serpin B